MNLRPTTSLSRLGLALAGIAVAFATPAHALTFSHSEVVEEGARFAPDGFVIIGNVNGAVTVRTWDKPEIAVHATKHAKSESDLARIELNIDLAPDVATVLVRLPKAKSGWFGNTMAARVDLVVTVPASAELKDVNTVNGSVSVDGLQRAVKVSTTNGKIEAANLVGPARLSTTNGAIQAHLNHASALTDVSLRTVNGSITVNLPADADLDLESSVVNGNIDCDLPLTVQGRVSRKHLKGQLGTGGGRLHLDTVNGSIRISPLR